MADSFRIEATYPLGRKEVFTKQTMKAAIELGNRLKQIGVTFEIKAVRGR